MTNLTAGWTAQEQTFINGVQVGNTGVLNADTNYLDQSVLDNLTSPLTAEVKYTISDPGGLW